MEKIIQNLSTSISWKIHTRNICNCCLIPYHGKEGPILFIMNYEEKGNLQELKHTSSHTLTGIRLCEFQSSLYFTAYAISHKFVILLYTKCESYTQKNESADYPHYNSNSCSNNLEKTFIKTIYFMIPVGDVFI